MRIMVYCAEQRCDVCHIRGLATTPEKFVLSERRRVPEELLVDWKGRLVNPMLAASAGSASHV